MRHPIRRLRSAVIGITALAAACATSHPDITADDVRVAAETGQLPVLYERIEAELASPDLGDADRVELKLRLEEVGRRLGARVEGEIDAALDASRLPSGRVPLAVVDGFGAETSELERWSLENYARVVQELDAERDATQRAIDAEESELRGLSDAQIAEKLALYDRLRALYGADSADGLAYAERGRALVTGLLRSAAAAGKREDYDEALRLYSTVARIEPSDAHVQQQIAQIEAKLFTQRFDDALARGRPDEAHRALLELSDAPNFARVRQQLSGSAERIANEVVDRAVAATKAGDLPSAYRLFGEARDVRALLGAPPAAPGSVAPFVAELERRARLAGAAGLDGLAWGTLLVVADVTDADPDLTRRMREARGRVAKQSVERLGITRFEDSDAGTAGYGGVLTANVARYLRKHSSDDVEVVERPEPDAKGAPLAFVVEGHVLEAKVERSDANASEVGVFSVSYRMIDAETAKVLFADTQRIKREVAAASGDGDAGDVLAPLALEISDGIGARLADVLASPDERFEVAGDRLVLEDRFAEAAEQLARALVRRESRDADPAELRAKLRAAAVRATPPEPTPPGP